MKIPTFEELRFGKTCRQSHRGACSAITTRCGMLEFPNARGSGGGGAAAPNIGIEEVPAVRAEGMNIPPLAIHAVPNGEKAIEALVF